MKPQSLNIQQAYQLADKHYQAGRLQQAEQICRQILAAKPNNPEANRLLGVIACRVGHNDLGIQLIRKSIKVAPNYAMAHLSLGNALIARGSLDEATVSINNALAIEPNMFGAYLNLGTVCSYKNLHDEAIACYRKSISLRPDFALTHNNLGNALKDKGKINESIKSYQNALRITPNLFEAHSNLGNALRDLGEITEAIKSYRKALKIRPESDGAHSNLIYALLSNPSITRQEIYMEARKWEQQFAKPIYSKQRPHDNIIDKSRRLRIGYVSPDFRSHPVNFFFEPVLKSHNRNKFEIYLYSNVRDPDQDTKRLQAEADHWLSIMGTSDEDVAERIREDRIDILVDLAKHTADNRLLVFAHKPAPVQVTWMGYPDTTGMEAIDYRFVDELICPGGEADELNSEELIRLPHGYFCFEPRVDAPEVVDTPVKKTGRLTFGSFNNLHKINTEVIALWSEILKKVPNSQLLFISNAFVEETAKKRFLDLFTGHGVKAERIEMILKVPFHEYLALYGRVDIALDPFPYNGHTTTCDGLWMGVPLITLRSKPSCCRVGGSILTRIGLQDLIAENKQEYVDKAIGLAGDIDFLSSLRAGLRDRVSTSSLCGIKAFTKSIEDAYLKMWERYISL